MLNVIIRLLSSNLFLPSHITTDELYQTNLTSIIMGACENQTLPLYPFDVHA